MATWDNLKSKATEAGFSESETQNIAAGLADQMTANGNSVQDFEDFFGKPKEPDPGQLADHFNQQFKRNMPANPDAAPVDQNTFGKAVVAGFQSSVGGMVARHALPDTQLEGPSLFDDQSAGDQAKGAAQRLVQGATQGAMDLPFMAMGAFGGSFAGPVGAASGAFAVPQAMRDALVTAYKQGGVHSAQDFTNMADSAFMGAIKGGLTGYVTASTGGAAKALTATAPGFMQAIAPLAGEAGAMTGFSAALDKKLPEPKDFLDAALQIAGFHAAGSIVPDKTQTVYKDTGIHPHDLGVMAMNDPVVKQEILSHTDETPPSLQNFKQPEVRSDFVIKDGKLIPGDKAEAQNEFDFAKTTVSKMVEDSQERLTMDKRAQAARLHDPEAFKAMDSMDREIRENKARIEQNTEALQSFRNSEEQLSRLNEVRKNLDNPNLTVEEGHALTEKELELSKNEDQLKKDTQNAANIRNENQVIQARLDRISQNTTIKERLAKAWEAGQKTLESNLKDRIRNKVIELHETPDAKPMAGFNSEFGNPDHNVPQMEQSGKLALMDDSNLHLFYGDEGRELTREQVLAHLMKNHEELANSIAPEIVEKHTPLSSEGEAAKKPSLVVTARNKKPSEALTASNFVKNYFDNLKPNEEIEKATEKRLGRKLTLDESPTAQVLRSRASDKEIQSSIGVSGEKEGSSYGIYDKDGNKLSDSWTKIHEDGGITEKNADDFRRFRLYKAIIDENEKGNLTGVDDAEARNFVAEHEKEFGKTAKKLTDWNNAYLRRAQSEGLLKASQVDKWEADHPNYVSFARANEDLSSKSSGLNRKNIVYSREGSELPFIDPAATDIEKARNIEKKIAQNKAVRAMVKLNELQEGGSNILIESSPKVSIDEGAELDKDPTFSRNADVRAKLDENQKGYFDQNGNYKVIQFKDLDVAKTLDFMGFDPGTAAGLNYWLRPAAKLTRAVVSGGWDFMVRHIIRDELNTSIVNKDFRTPFLGTIANLGEAIGKKSDFYVEAQRAGAFKGVMADIEGIAKNPTYHLNDKEGGWSTAWNVIKTPWQLSHAIIKLSAEAKLLSIYKENVKQLPEGATWADKEQAGYDAMNSSVNGLRMGAKMQGAMSAMAFIHYDMQGLYSGFKAAKENPKSVAVGGALLTSAAVALWYANHDDPDYQRIPDYEKNAFLHIKVGGTYLKIPTPWTMGALFAAVPARLLDYAKSQDPNSLKSLGETLGGLVPIIDPLHPERTLDKISLIGMADQIFHNYNPITGKNIIPGMLQDKAPLDQQQPYTSNTAIAVAKALAPAHNWLVGPAHMDSPIMVDHAIQMFLGQPGQFAIKAIETSLQKAGLQMPNEKPPYELADLPFIGGIISREATYNAQPLVDFREAFNELEAKHSHFNDLEKAGKYEEADAWQQAHPELQNYDQMRDAHEMIKEQNKAIQGISIDPNLSAADKKQTMTPMWRTMVDSAKQKLDELNKASKN